MTSTLPAARRCAVRLLCALVLAVPGSELFAQSGDQPAPDGTWWTVSVEAAGARLTCDLCDRSRDLGAGVGASFGSYASPALRLGVDGSVWSHRAGDVRERVWAAGIVAELHPRVGSGLHLIGGAGWSGYRAGGFSHDAPSIRLGLGWDLPLSAGWVVGNRVVLDAASFGSLDADGTTVAGAVGLSVLRFGLYLRHR